jgi:hypothetical protein
VRPCVPALSAQAPQDITVVGVPAFRPTAVLLPHFQFWVAVDTAAGGVVLRDLTINPVTFTGWVRVEGIQPGARQPESAPFPDSVRFGSDGRVTLLIADSALGAPLQIEPQGVPGAAAGRLEISAPRWPLNRAVLVTIDPADLYEHRWRSVGYGVRDRITVDDERHVAFLRDSTIANTVIAIAPGRGTQAAIRVEQTSIVVTQQFGQSVGRERRALGRLVLALEPTRDADGGMHAEVVFGSGDSEDAAASAVAAALEGRTLPPAPVGPRVATPSADVANVLAHILRAAGPMLRYDRIARFRNIPAGSYTFLAAFDRDGWYGTTTALQLGDPEVVCSEYALMKQFADPSGAQRHEIWNRLGAGGRYVWTDDWGGRWMGDKDPYEILKGYACYRATQDTAWLGSELRNLRHIAHFVLATDRNGNGLVEGMSYATYSEMSPLDPRDQPYRTEDPYVNALAAYALDRLAELEDEAALRFNVMALGDSAAAWRAAASRIRAALPMLYRPQMGWFTYHAMADSARSWDHYHLQPVDALVFDGVADTAISGAMVRRRATTAGLTCAGTGRDGTGTSSTSRRSKPRSASVRRPSAARRGSGSTGRVRGSSASTTAGPGSAATTTGSSCSRRALTSICSRGGCSAWMSTSTRSRSRHTSTGSPTIRSGGSTAGGSARIRSAWPTGRPTGPPRSSWPPGVWCASSCGSPGWCEGPARK